MARRKSIEIRRQLTSLIPTRRLNALARQSWLVQRERKVQPLALFWTIVLTFGAGGERTLAGMRRAHEKSSGQTLVPSAFYDRFTQPLAAFFRAVTLRLMENLRRAGVQFRGLLDPFWNVLATDTTLVKLHDLLERRCPACRTNHTRAAAKLHLVMSLQGQGPRSVKLTSGRQHDWSVFRVGRWFRAWFLFLDLGTSATSCSTALTVTEGTSSRG